MVSAQAKLVVYAVVVSAALVELVGSTVAGVWHSPVYWTAVSCMIPAGLIGIRRIYLANAADAPGPAGNPAARARTVRLGRSLWPAA